MKLNVLLQNFRFISVPLVLIYRNKIWGGILVNLMLWARLTKGDGIDISLVPFRDFFQISHNDRCYFYTLNWAPWLTYSTVQVRQMTRTIKPNTTKDNRLTISKIRPCKACSNVKTSRPSLNCSVVLQRHRCMTGLYNHFPRLILVYCNTVHMKSNGHWKILLLTSFETTFISRIELKYF